MSVLMISMIETDLTRSAPIGPERDSKRIFGVPSLRWPMNSQACSRDRRAHAARSARGLPLTRPRTRAAESSPACRRAAFQDRAGLVDQPARGTLFIAAELRLNVHTLLPGR
jgi:hypothetical protein